MPNVGLNLDKAAWSAAGDAAGSDKVRIRGGRDDGKVDLKAGKDTVLHNVRTVGNTSVRQGRRAAAHEFREFLKEETKLEGRRPSRRLGRPMSPSGTADRILKAVGYKKGEGLTGTQIKKAVDIAEDLKSFKTPKYRRDFLKGEIRQARNGGRSTPTTPRSIDQLHRHRNEISARINTHRSNLSAEATQLRNAPPPASAKAKVIGLNNQGWLTITNNSRSGDYTETTTPINNCFHSNYSSFRDTGFCSDAQKVSKDEMKTQGWVDPLLGDLKRPTNFWKTEISSGGATQFKAWRSGCMAGKFLGKTDPASVAVARDNATEFLKAIGLSKAMETGFDPLQPITVTSINMMNRGKMGGAEGRAVKMQEEAFAHVTQGPITVTHQGVTHQLTFQVNTLAIPTNTPGVLNRFSARSGDNATIHRLCNEAKASGNAESKMLAAEIEKAMKTGLKGAKHRGYQFPALVSNLAHQLGHEAAYNCKSGKDRTGMMDISSKFVALRVRNKMQSPATDKAPIWDLKERDNLDLYSEVALNTSSLEITKKNTGATGLKIGAGKRNPQAWFQGIPKFLHASIMGNSGNVGT